MDKKPSVQVRVRMKNEDIYAGCIHFYPFLADSKNSLGFQSRRISLL